MSFLGLKLDLLFGIELLLFNPRVAAAGAPFQKTCTMMVQLSIDET